MDHAIKINTEMCSVSKQIICVDLTFWVCDHMRQCEMSHTVSMTIIFKWSFSPYIYLIQTVFLFLQPGGKIHRNRRRRHGDRRCIRRGRRSIRLSVGRRLVVHVQLDGRRTQVFAASPDSRLSSGVLGLVSRVPEVQECHEILGEKTSCKYDGDRDETISYVGDVRACVYCSARFVLQRGSVRPLNTLPHFSLLFS